jgi:hypothetical protein
MKIAKYEILSRKSLLRFLNGKIRRFVYFYEDVLRLSILSEDFGFNDGRKGSLGIREGNDSRLAVSRVVPEFLTESLEHWKQAVH